MPAKGKGRCRFIDDDVDVSDAVDDDGEEGEEGGPRRGRKRRKQARIASSDEEEGDDVPTKEDLEFVVDDHVSEAEEEEEKVRISRKERRVGRDEMNLMLENVGLRTRRYKDEKKKVKTSMWKDDDDEDSVHTSDQGFVVDDDEEEEEEDDEAEEAGEGEDDDGEEVDSAKDEDGETIATSSEAGSEDMSDPFVLDASNILSEALRFRRETAFESTSLSEVLGRMHRDGRWILSMDIMRAGIPSMFVEEFAARCVGCTVMSAKVIESLCVPLLGGACEFVRVSFAPDGVPPTVVSAPIRAESPAEAVVDLAVRFKI